MRTFSTAKILALTIVLLMAFADLGFARGLHKLAAPKPIPSDEQAGIERRGAVRAPSFPFFDDMEIGDNGWTATGFWNRVTNPHQIRVADLIRTRLVQLPDSGYLPPSFSGSACWWYGEAATGTFIGQDYNQAQAGDPENPAPLTGGTSQSSNEGSLVSPDIDLTGVTQATLSFFTWWEIEGVDVNAFDMMYVEVSTDGGITYEAVKSLNPLNDANTESYICYSTNGVNAPGEWGKVVADLSPWTGNIVRLRFRFDTVDSLYNGFRGWLVDDVRVDGSTPPTLTLTSIDPAVAAVGTLVTAHGGGFASGASLTMGGASATLAVIFQDKIVAYVPDLANGVYDVTVSNPGGASATLTNALTVSDETPPTIDAIQPASAGNGAPTNITITGADFASGAMAYLGQTLLYTVTVVDSNTITATVPANLAPGFYNVIVVNPDGLQATLFSGFEVTGAAVGAISGQVVSGTTGLPIAGASITISGPATISTTSDAQGNYAATDLPPGNYAVAVTANGYITDTSNTLILAGQTTTLNFALSLTIGQAQYRAVLTWGDQPLDLDSHIWVPTGSGCEHVYWSHKGSAETSPFTFLDIDDTTGVGPETVTITLPHPGVYQYWIHNYSQSPNMDVSGAVVKLYRGDELVHQYDMPLDNANDVKAWHVFDFEPTTGALTDVDALVDVGTGSSLTAGTCTDSTCGYTVAPLAASIGASGGNGQFNVATTAGCVWSAVSQADWITITAGATGNVSNTVQFVVATNTTGATRTGTILAAGQAFIVTQSGAHPAPVGALVQILD